MLLESGTSNTLKIVKVRAFFVKLLLESHKV